MEHRHKFDEAIEKADTLYASISQTGTLSELSTMERQIREIMMELTYSVSRLGYWYQEAVNNQRRRIMHPEEVQAYAAQAEQKSTGKGAVKSRKSSRVKL